MLGKINLMKKWFAPLALAACLVASVSKADTYYNRFRDVRDVPNAAPKVDNNSSLSALPYSYAPSVLRLGYAAAGDAPPVLYTRSNSACSLNAGAGDGGSQVPTSDGKCWVWSKPTVTDARIFGMDTSGASSANVPLAAAFAATGTGTVALPSGATALLTDALTISAAASLSCSGNGGATIKVDYANFNMAAAGVIVLAGGAQPAAGFGDNCKITAVQPDTSVRANLKAYPPAIYVATPEFRLGKVRISQFPTCVDARGNTGRSYIERLECGAYSYGLRIDGSLGFIHVASFAESPYDMTANQISIYGDGTNLAAEIGRCDGCVFGMFSAFEAGVAITANNNQTTGLTFGSVTLDGDGANLTHAAGITRIGTLYSTKSNTNAWNAVSVSGGLLTIGNIGVATTSTVPDFVVTGGTLKINGGIYQFYSQANSAAAVTAGRLVFDNTQIILNASNRAAPVFAQSGGGALVMRGNAFSDSGGSTGSAISIGADVITNYIANNNLGRWDITAAFTTSNGYYDFGDYAFALTSTPQFTTPGDFSLGSNTVTGEYFRRGSFVTFTLSDVFTYTATTASGSFSMLTNMPAAINTNSPCTIGGMSNITFGSAILLGCEIQSQAIFPRLFTTGAGLGSMNQTNVISGTSTTFRIGGTYRVR